MPAFRTGHPRCSLIFTGNHVLAAGTVLLTWDAAEYDDVGGWNGTTDYVCDRPGLWLIVLSVARSAVASSSTSSIRIRVNGTIVQTVAGPPTSNGVNNQAVAILSLAAGDAVSANVNLNPTTGGTINAASSSLRIVRIGPKAWT